MFFRFFDFGLEVDLVEFEFRLCDGSGRSVYSPSEYVEQIDDRYSVETFVDEIGSAEKFGVSTFTSVSSKPRLILVV